MKSKKYTGLCCLLCATILPFSVLGQQTIGSFPLMEGGFEGQAAGALTQAASIATGVQSTAWTVTTTTNTTATITASGARSGNQYINVSQLAGGSSLRVNSPSSANGSLLNSTTYVFQYYYRTTATPTNVSIGITTDGTAGGAAGSTVSGLVNTNGIWTKVTKTITTNSSSNSPRYGLGQVVRSTTTGTAMNPIDFDDFVVYQGSAADETAPNSPGIVTMNVGSNAIDVSWGAASGGVDGGGYVVVRYTSLPSANDDPNQNGIYSVGQTIAGTTTGTVRYIGTATNFTDNQGINNGTTYYYKVYTVDKAFNYSLESLSLNAYQAGTVYYGANNYIEYRAGNLPIIVTAPHGGDIEPVSIPDRSCANCIIIADANTDDLAAKLDASLRTSLNGYPHIIINHLHRSKLDANREIVEAADGNATAEAAWREWEAFVLAAKNNIIQNSGKGLMIDLHGHGHTIQRLELGFDLTAAELRLSDATLDNTTYRDKTSIKTNITNNPNSFNTPQMIRGDFALGTLLADRGYPSVPSKQDVAPALGDDYFDGGYNVERYGSNDGSAIDAIQIECNYTGVRNSSANRTAFATQAAAALKAYLQKHYFPVLPVSLSQFAGVRMGAINRLLWQTEVETNNAGFDIERSLDGKNFTKWAFIPSKAKGGNSNRPLEYTLDDNTPLSILTYYRLKQTDFDGQIAYSRIISVEGQKGQNVLSVYPNPTKGKLNIIINNSEEGQAHLSLYSLQGQLVWQKTMELTNGTADVSLELPPLSKGVYILRVSDRKNSFASQTKVFVE
ncbi:MAG: T9SS type A sorting domain-containing protein [Saprospiraceae bacterium]|nr:T9SS type A sorting domain-containing protein [Saprospiraceae bacterium]